MVGNTERIIERTIYPEVVKELQQLGFQNVLGEAGEGTSRRATDVTFSYEGTKFLAEVKFGDIKKETATTKDLSQARGYAERKGTKNYMLLIYPELLRGHKYIGAEWFTNQCLNEKIRCILFTDVWQESVLESPKEVFIKLQTLLIKKQKQVSMEFTVKQLQTTVQDLIRINNYANKAKLVDEVVSKIKLFIGVGGLEKQKHLEQELVNLSTYLLFNQLLFYRIYRVKVPDAKLPPLKNIKEKRELQQFFGKLQTKGYGPIYEVNVLAHISNKPEVIEVINEVIEAIKSLRPEQISHDIAGVFFHKLVPFEIRKVLATYYTVPNAADLLAGLAIRGAHQSVLDPACGSGTLLVASYKRKEHLWTKYEGGYTSEKMHKQFLEKDITGNDLMPFAGHLATMNLAMQNIEQPTKNVRIGSGDSLSLAYQFADPNFKKGITQGKFTTHQTTSMDEFLGSNKKAKRSTKSASGSLSTEFKLTPCDLVIMNPPFSDIEKIIKVSPEMITKLKENRILSDKCGNAVNLWGYFLVLADLALNKEGRTAAVIPISIARGKATQKIRDFMLENFSTRFIVKPSNEDEAFSQNASLKDILFIADKRKPTEDDKTAFVFFKSSVKNMESTKITEDIVEELNEQYSLLNINETKSTKDYTIKIINTTKLLDYSSNFMPLFTKSPLVEEFVKRIIEIGKPVFRKIAKGDTKELYTYPKKPRGFIEMFAITNELDKSRTTKAFFILKKKQKNSIIFGIKNSEQTYEIPLSQTEPFLRTLTGVKSFGNCGVDFAITKPPKKEWEDVSVKWKKNRKFNWYLHNKILQENRSYVFLASNFRPDSDNTFHLAFHSPQKICAPHTLKALLCESEEEGMYQTLLLNSSFGVALMLMYRSQSSGGKAQIGAADYEHYDIFDVSKLSKEQKDKLTKLFNKLNKIEFPSLKEQYQYNNEHRRSLDIGVLEILGLSKQEINDLLDKIYPVFPDEFSVD